MTGIVDASLLTGIILNTLDHYKSKNISDRDINKGHCEEFSDIVMTKLLGPNWITFNDDIIQEVETANFVVRNKEGFSINWDWVLLAERWGVTAPIGVSLEKLLEVARYEPNHIWITSGKRHFDSESPYGVDSFFDLKFFRRWLDLED